MNRITNIDLNLLKNFMFSDNSFIELRKLDEEIDEFYEAQGRYADEDFGYNLDFEIAEGLDVITVMLNYLRTIGLTKEHFDKHIEKLKMYKQTKYK